MAVDMTIAIACASTMTNAMSYPGIDHRAAPDSNLVPHSFSLESQALSK
jgi:hypothetical protein